MIGGLVMRSIKLDDRTSISHSFTEDGDLMITLHKKIISGESGDVVSNFKTFLTVNGEDMKELTCQKLARLVYKAFCSLRRERKFLKKDVSRYPSFEELIDFSKTALGEA